MRMQLLCQDGRLYPSGTTAHYASFKKTGTDTQHMEFLDVWFTLLYPALSRPYYCKVPLTCADQNPSDL